MYKYYLKQIEYLQELIANSKSLIEEAKSLMEDGEFINAYNIIDEKLHRKLTSMKFKIDGIEGNMKRDKESADPIRNFIIDELVSSELSTEPYDNYGEYSRDYLSDLTDIELVKRFHSLFGSMKLHVLLKESSISNQ